MLARTLAVGLRGVEGRVIEVECDIANGLPGLAFTGLADTAVVESRDRLRAALGNCGIDWPNRKITVALLPADQRKSGSRFDLALAVALLAAAEQVPAAAVASAVWIAELGLDGRLRPVTGVLPSVVAARRAGARRVVVARGNAAEAALVGGLDVRCGDRLSDVVAWLRGDGPTLETADDGADDGGCEGGDEPDGGGPDGTPSGATRDLTDVAGQSAAKQALAITAAGGHHLHMVGVPGAGKTMLAERLPGLLPTLDDAAALEVTAVHSIAGLLGERARLVRRPPLQAPHHTASIAALVGGGSHLARPGAISLAHHGVLFLDEAAEFSSRALDALRQPLENGYVVLHRGGGAVRYPSRFQLVLAANPCPCAQRARSCACAPAVRRRYAQRLSGPLLDRIDLRVHVDPVTRADLFDRLATRESTSSVAARVATARAAAAERWRDTTPWRVNADVPGSTLRDARWMVPRRVLAPAERHLETGALSARGLDRVLRVAWTIADLAGHDRPGESDVSEALFFRTGGSEVWAA